MKHDAHAAACQRHHDLQHLMMVLVYAHSFEQAVRGAVESIEPRDLAMQVEERSDQTYADCRAEVSTNPQEKRFHIPGNVMAHNLARLTGSMRFRQY